MQHYLPDGERSRREVTQVEHRVEELVAHAHQKQDSLQNYKHNSQRHLCCPFLFSFQKDTTSCPWILGRAVETSGLMQSWTCRRRCGVPPPPPKPGLCARGGGGSTEASYRVTVSHSRNRADGFIENLFLCCVKRIAHPVCVVVVQNRVGRQIDFLVTLTSLHRGPEIQCELFFKISSSSVRKIQMVQRPSRFGDQTQAEFSFSFCTIHTTRFHQAKLILGTLQPGRTNCVAGQIQACCCCDGWTFFLFLSKTIPWNHQDLYRSDSDQIPGSFPENSRVEMEPVRYDVNGHAQLEEEHVSRVEVAQHDQQTHRRRAIRQLIQHRSELRTWCRNFRLYFVGESASSLELYSTAMALTQSTSLSSTIQGNSASFWLPPRPKRCECWNRASKWQNFAKVQWNTISASLWKAQTNFGGTNTSEVNLARSLQNWTFFLIHSARGPEWGEKRSPSANEQTDLTNALLVESTHLLCPSMRAAWPSSASRNPLRM